MSGTMSRTHSREYDEESLPCVCRHKNNVESCGRADVERRIHLILIGCCYGARQGHDPRVIRFQ